MPPGELIRKEAVVDANEETLQECMRIQKLARSVDELVAWSFILDEKEVILNELEKVVGDTEQELQKAEGALEFQRRRCALIEDITCVNSEHRSQRPHAARGDDSEINVLWKEHGDSFIRQYERHLTRFKRVCKELLEDPTAVPTTPELIRWNDKK